MSYRVPFIITIDAEADNNWSRPEILTTRNSEYVERFQQLCEKYGHRPTYLTSWEMFDNEVYVDFCKDVQARGVGEIGTHLHGWDSPPFYDLTQEDTFYQPYAIEYPKEVMREKLKTLTARSEDLLQVKMTSHRAGRWAVNGSYLQCLQDLFYEADCSVTPHISWHKGEVQPGAKMKGFDFSRAPEHPYHPSFKDVCVPGDATLLEVPLTSLGHSKIGNLARASYYKAPFLVRKVIDRVYPHRTLRPTLGNLKDLKGILDQSLGATHVEFMLHSSEFMPGGSPYFPDEKSIEELYADMEALFDYASTGFIGQTLTEFTRAFRARRLGEEPVPQQV